MVTQETSLSMSPGGTVTITCGSSTRAVTTSNHVSWVQQKPYQVPQGLISSTSNLNPGVPARFSSSLVGQKAALTITGAQTEDEAQYYCALWYSNYDTKTEAGGEVHGDFRGQPLEGSLCLYSSFLTWVYFHFRDQFSGRGDPGDFNDRVPRRDSHSHLCLQYRSGHQCSLSILVPAEAWPIPRTLIFNTNSKHSWTPAWFSGSLLGGKAALTLTEAQPEDEAEYHCWLVYDGVRHS
ncbi:hypothetical protein GH733_015968, partial [Mirounga leonina]